MSDKWALVGLVLLVSTVQAQSLHSKSPLDFTADAVASQVTGDLSKYTGTFQKIDEMPLAGDSFAYTLAVGSILGESTGDPNAFGCLLASFDLSVSQTANGQVAAGTLELRGAGLSCSVESTSSEPQQTVQNFSYYVVSGTGAFAEWKSGNGSGHLTSHTFPSGNNPQTILHIDGGLVLN